jgi:hypothetical protein
MEHFHACLRQMRHFRAATVAVALSPAQRQLPLQLQLPLLLTWVPVDGDTSLVPKSDKEASAV